MQKEYFEGTLEKRVKLNSDQAKKNVYHISLLIDAQKFSYNAGSCIAIHPKNPQSLVKKILNLFATPEGTLVKHPKNGSQLTAYTYLQNQVNLWQTRSTLVKFLLPHLKDPQEIKKHTQEDLLSFLQACPLPLPSIEKILPFLGPLLPRYYSISSSQITNKNQLDLMISTLDLKNEHIQTGITSGYLTNDLNVGDCLKFTYHDNPKFSLPICQNTPIIMIGPGTGFAPFRGFLQELKEKKNPTWLFTGAQTKKHHYYYEQEFKEKTHLRFSHAFSRDQKEKIYVQHLIEKNGDAFFSWMEKGAKIYICGDATNMAKDVQEAILKLLVKKKNVSILEAKEQLKSMRKQGTLNLDVY